MKKILITLFLLPLSAAAWGQKVAIKNNLLYDAILTPNLGIEVGLSRKSTLDFHVGYNPFTFSDGKKFKHLLVQPEYRRWFCERFNGTFWGIHLHGGEFSIANLKWPTGRFPELKDGRYEGYFIGGGLSIGHQWVLGNRWNIEATIGAGYAFIDYEQYRCAKCSPKPKDGTYHYFGITKAAVSIIFMIK